MNNTEILNQATNESQFIFKNLAELDSGIKKKAYFVLSSRFGQFNLTNDVFQILKEFPRVFGPDDFGRCESRAQI
jgi:hypothetical protein